MSLATAAAFSSVTLIRWAKPPVGSSRLSAACQPSPLAASEAGLLARPALPPSTPSFLFKPLWYGYSLGNKGIEGLYSSRWVCQEWGAQTLGIYCGYPRPEILEMTRASGPIWVRNTVCPLATVLYSEGCLGKRTILCCSSLWTWGPLCGDALALTVAQEKPKEGHKTENKSLINLKVAGRMSHIADNDIRNIWSRFCCGGSPPDNGNGVGR